MAVRSVGIISKPRKRELQQIIPDLFAWLDQRKVAALMDRETASGLEPALRGELHSRVVPRSELCGRSDLILVLGGDGTLLAAARHAHVHNLPILAVNLGSLGFLTDTPIDDLYPSLQMFFEGKHRLDCRKMLQTSVIRSGATSATYHALNDAVLNKAAIARILDFEAYVDGEFLSVFKADGLIVSTPTGSTAYSMSAGGPIIAPPVEAFIITPICSHTLTNRPIVVPDRSRIEIVVKTEAESVFLTVDGQVGLALHNEDRIVCGLSQYRVSLVRPPQKGFFEVLRGKLKWGGR